MTGEITLSGAVLPVGGIREKVLAAHRAGIKKVILPKENERDLPDVPEEVRGELVFVPVGTVEEYQRGAGPRSPRPIIVQTGNSFVPVQTRDLRGRKPRVPSPGSLTEILKEDLYR